MQAAARNTGREQGREPTKTIADEEWEQKRKDTSISREHMDMLVLNFLVTEVRMRMRYSVMIGLLQARCRPSWLTTAYRHLVLS